jgi:hypothetical protein
MVDNVAGVRGFVVPAMMMLLGGKCRGGEHHHQQSGGDDFLHASNRSIGLVALLYNLW